MPHYGLTQEGAATTIRANAVCTASYVASSVVDLKSYDSVSVGAIIGTTGSETISIKFQWSMDTSIATPLWFDEGVISYGTASGGEQPETFNSKRVDVSGASAGQVYIERFRRLARYFRIVAKSTGTTATLSVIAKPAVNSN